MKKFFSILAMACAIMIAGCKTPPSEDTIRKTAESVGRAAGYAVELSKTKTEVKDAILNILDTAAKVVPDTDQTFIAAWKPLIDEEVAKLITDGKIKESDGTLVKSVLYVACDGIDILFTRYPKAREYKNLVSAATEGFVAGFKSVVHLAAGVKLEYDEEAYRTLSKKFKNR